MPGHPSTVQGSPLPQIHSTPGPVWVMGAGAVGCYVGGCLAAAGVDVTFVGRQPVIDELSRHGLTVSDCEGASHHIALAPRHLALAMPPDARPALVLLTVKSAATTEAANQLDKVLPAGTTIVSLQNGIGNADAAQQSAPMLRVLPGMVPYNIAQTAPATYHRGTAGRLAALDDAALRPWVDVFERAGIPIDLKRDLRPTQWGKLLINLNNAVNALSGLPLRDELMDRGFRRCFAALIDEGLDVLSAAGITPASVIAVPVDRLPTVLRLPNVLFRLVAARMLRIDPQARSSMADDLTRGRRTEIDALCGEVVRLARAHERAAPRNAKMVELLDGGWPQQPQRLSSAALCRELGI